MCKDYGSYCGICLGVKPGGQLYLRDLNPIISLFARQRIQIDLINMSHYRFPDFTHFLHLKDHYSNFSYVQGLQSKSATEVQRALEIYLSTNPSPMLLQSDNGRKFVNATIKALLVERKIGEVHSSPNSIEPANEIFKKYFDANLREYGITATDNDPKYGKFPHVTLLIARTVYQMNKTRAHDGSTSPMAVYFRMDPIIEENYQKLIKILKKMTSSPTDAEKAKVLKHELETILEKQQSVCHVENSDRRK
ncbi:hypothetical protein WICPIJ_005532 [Wickerhamomyces pijperi]|uniref:Integrase catalytic domain-containing protein n=1 Tax=Wickerhamomyces pijperi TaxID=599730 RepID=A0A9P8Q5Z9_WICPI|nr:hypothetical protein WICPIJ_005532 [Wickerhamomyces pijperi]